MRAVKRTAGSDDLVWIDLADYQRGHIAGLHIAGTSVPSAITMWMDDSADRTARIVRLGPQRHIVELRNAQDTWVLEDPTADQCAKSVGSKERSVLEHDSLAPAQIILSSLIAESHARTWLERAEVPEGLRLVPWPDR